MTYKRDAVRQTQAAMLDFHEQSTRFVNIELDLAITFCKLGLVTANKKTAKRNAEHARKALGVVQRITPQITLGNSETTAISEKVAYLETLLTKLERDLESL